MNDGLIVEGFFMSSLLSPVWLLGYSPIYVISCLDIHVHITKEVHLLAEVVVPGSCGDGGFLTEGYSW